MLSCAVLTKIRPGEVSSGGGSLYLVVAAENKRVRRESERVWHSAREEGENEKTRQRREREKRGALYFERKTARKGRVGRAKRGSDKEREGEKIARAL